MFFSSSMLTRLRKNKHQSREILFTSLKLGSIGFGGIAGMIAMIEDEIVIKRKWIDRTHFLDIVSAANIVPGPNSVEIVMHCGKERGGKTGLVLAGIGYILPASLICLLLAFFYTKYGHLPAIQHILTGIRPATTALVVGTVIRLAGSIVKSGKALIAIAILVFAGSLAGINEILLILLSGAVYAIYQRKKYLFRVNSFLFPLLFINLNLSVSQKLFLIFLKIGALLFGSGYVLYAYMNDSLVEANHWLTKQQLVDAIAVGQITPGPILSSATFAGYVINGPWGALWATTGIFLPSFFISFFMHKLVSAARKNSGMRAFLDGLNAASVAVIAAVGYTLLTPVFSNWREALILGCCLVWMLIAKRVNPALLILFGSAAGYLLLLF